ncbi:1-(5-phosphoribosyl)-5-[(5-phosphoribosylamino)methylideneamino]imidazole-4-carboxamide isomerase [Hazenella sp. IB182357]|uniref:1-(5-phosphoribosyl)-5-[(5-phosphoribosylamino)methylideneamino] imidazole-4-carboxamide isomerase n=1 Tax=Polycladospora coralii TaxID=2771432 RepID=A0A926NC93_9BACL|nr:1-(5-phosphoribosyl)-5-[(5-phosphoribosylamino)methylideneamino]imidazole-4-carboxamide isomerase [Polycladospora coralii]MBD1372740.1 1-(5-phosphoribosyl)-5-[(5-phosphoribosylamino)methylideneamino]imidazole-4-carboxamide isomerase [Polycladospora coralii]
MSFTIYPAIDMRNGRCVRLQQGDYNEETVYGDSPYSMAKHFADQGAEWIHMVDLDGAKDGASIHDEFVIQVAKELKVKIQIGGGIRNERDIDYYLKCGIDRVIIGSAAVTKPDFTINMIQKYRSKIAIGIDAKNGYVATNGWLNTSKTTAVELAKQLANAGAETFIFTDIARDGMLRGPNFDAIAQIAQETGKQVIASGGVSDLNDLNLLKGFSHLGVSGVIVGKAIYEGKFSVRDALQYVD